MRKHAFTLIELLVVVSIIALLVAILLPALANARLRAKEVLCAADERSLTQVGIAYAIDNFSKLPDYSLKPGTTSTYPSNIYWSWPAWRIYIETSYGIQRSQWVGPTHESWQGDELYYWPNSNPNTATHFILGRFYFTSDKANSDSVYNGLQISIPPAQRPLFARSLSDRSYWTLMWADLNREHPASPGRLNWAMSGASRLGATHLYGEVDEMSAGSHESHLDGHVEWIPGDDLVLTVNANNTELYW
ncbi:type II secretion system protein [Planctomycetales bacterium ZRK34]|nr:type II secretion system protein [Planctomycetales bacterium ZRK34]